NTTYCLKVAVPLLVFQKGSDGCTSNEKMTFPFELAVSETKYLRCPDTANFSETSVNSTIAWYRECSRVRMDNVREIEGGELEFHSVREYHEGGYTCILTVMRRGHPYNLTRTVVASICASQNHPRPPILIQPTADQQMEVEYDQEVNLTCKMYFHYIRKSPTIVWWSIDGRHAQELAPAIKIFHSEDQLKLKDKSITNTISFKTVTLSDLKRNYTCFGKNSQGLRRVLVTLVRKAPSYEIELGCALGVTLLILVTSIIVYHFWWIEIILLYRLYFGTDETIGDGKEYDVYVSYARNAEEEEFVLMTLRSVLENEYGYKVCIYDRDSLPGGIITDETLACMWRSRRLVVVLSPNYLLNGTQALLELKAGTERMASTGQIRVILVELIPVRKVSHVAELKRLKSVMTTIKWKGEKSQDLRSRFWKQLRVALPTRRKTQTSERSARLVYTNLDPGAQDGDLPCPPISESHLVASECLNTQRPGGGCNVSEDSTREAKSSILC
uniref:interleukin-1 receptor accessory protein-like n=1 Tax=Pristiophorus japonicus TaxID=55135 RepID=UPI00398F749B